MSRPQTTVGADRPQGAPAWTSRRTRPPGFAGLRSALVLLAVSALGLAMFTWPLFADPGSELAHSADAPLLFAAVLGMLVIVLAAELMAGGIDAKALAMLGVLAAVAAALRPLGGGVSGFQPMFVVLIVGGRALGPGFGFCLGLVAMFGSALITGGVGPWLPFQMLGAGWLGLGAGLLPRARGRWEVALLAGYGAVAGIAYGFLLNLWFWPFLTGTDAAISFQAEDPLAENLGRFLVFCLLTSLGFDIPRAVANTALIALAGGPMLLAVRRASRKANFVASPVFSQAAPTSATALAPVHGVAAASSDPAPPPASVSPAAAPPAAASADAGPAAGSGPDPATQAAPPG